ncbi:MAG: hypothetical protein ACRDF4_04915 [Rhabdochlamydiaceae bacterium]
MSKQPPYLRVPEFDVKFAPDYKILYVSGAFGGVDPIDGKLFLYLDRIIPRIKEGGQLGEMEAANKIERDVLVELRMSPETFKALAKWMQQAAEKLGT